MQKFRIVNESLRRGHDDRKTGLVVRAEQRCSIAGDNFLPNVVLQFRVLRSLDDHRLVPRQDDVSPAVIDYLRFYIGAALGRRCIDMRD